MFPVNGGVVSLFENKWWWLILLLGICPPKVL
jgi:hypothetical protein